MALPKIDTPIFDCDLPSNNKKVRFRPFLVKEQKLLLMAAESTEMKDVIQTIKQVISNCTLDDLDIDSLPVFDIEFLFLNLRARSVGEIVNVKYKCNNIVGTHLDKEGIEQDKHCNHIVEMDINVLEIEPKFGEGHTTKIEITKDVGIVMKYPSYEMIEQMVGKEENQVVFELLLKCVDYIYDNESIYYSKDFTQAELEEFVDNLQQEHLDKIKTFFDTMPKVKKMVDFTCTACGYHEDLAIEGIQNFFV